MIFLKDLEGRYLQVNRQFELTFKLTPDQVLGRTDAELFPPELAAFRATDRSVLEAGSSLEFEEQAVYADGAHTYSPRVPALRRCRQRLRRGLHFYRHHCAQARRR